MMKRRGFIASMAVVAVMPSVKGCGQSARWVSTPYKDGAWLKWVAVDGYCVVGECAQYQLGTGFAEKEVQQNTEYFSGT